MSPANQVKCDNNNLVQSKVVQGESEKGHMSAMVIFRVTVGIFTLGICRCHKRQEYY